MKRFLVLGAFATLFFTNAHAQQKTNPEDISKKMQWFADAKLGIFIHWGIYSVNGIDESWSFHNKKISYPDYMQQLKGFTANNYNPQAWADLIKESGARYAVMTTKHHDGVALWDSKYSKLDVANSTPAKRDVLTPFYAALRRDSIKCGAYFSLIDWSHNDYPQFLKDSNRYEIKAQPEMHLGRKNSRQICADAEIGGLPQRRQSGKSEQEVGAHRQNGECHRTRREQHHERAGVRNDPQQRRHHDQHRDDFAVDPAHHRLNRDRTSRSA